MADAMSKACQRDEAGFCVFALVGNPRCFWRGGQCAETDPMVARRHAVEWVVRQALERRKEKAREAASHGS